jgi:hypothetical protein
LPISDINDSARPADEDAAQVIQGEAQCDNLEERKEEKEIESVAGKREAST